MVHPREKWAGLLASLPELKMETAEWFPGKGLKTVCIVEHHQENLQNMQTTKTMILI